MGLNKIVKNLQKLLDTKKSRQLKRIDAVEDLVARLEKKQAKFSRKLEDAKSEKELKKIKRHIKVCKAQLKKGKAALETLQKDTHQA